MLISTAILSEPIRAERALDEMPVAVTGGIR